MSLILARLLNITCIQIPALHITFTRKSWNQHEHDTSKKLEKNFSLSLHPKMMPVKEQTVACTELANCPLDRESRWVMSYWILKGLDLQREERTLFVKDTPENPQQKATVCASKQFVLMSDQSGPLVVQRLLHWCLRSSCPAHFQS